MLFRSGVTAAATGTVSNTEIFASQLNGIHIQNLQMASLPSQAVRVPHNIPRAMTKIRFGFNAWALNPSISNVAQDNPNSLPVTEAYAECNGVQVPLTIGGSMPHAIAAGANDDSTQYLLPSDFGFVDGEFPAGVTIWTKWRTDFPNTTSYYPNCAQRDSSDQSGYQFWQFDPANTTVTMNVPGTMSATGTAVVSQNLFWAPFCIGVPVDPSLPAWIARGDSITQNAGDGTANAAGRGWFQLACAGLNLPNGNLSLSASKGQHGAGDARVEYWYSFAKAGVVFYGTNDFSTNGVADTVASVQGKVRAIRTAMIAKGVMRTAVHKLLIEADSTDNWATEANQTVYSGWNSGDRPDQFNQAIGTLGFDVVLPGDVVRGTVDHFKWLAQGTRIASDHHHPTNAGHVLLANEAAPLMDTGYVGAPYWTVAPSASGNSAVGNVLTCVDGTITNGSVSARQWTLDGINISGQTGTTYTVQAGDVGKAIRCKVTATGTGGTATRSTPSHTASAAIVGWKMRGVSTAAVTANTGGNLTLNEPTGVQAGDLMVACISYRDTPNFTLPAGWTACGVTQTNGDTVFGTGKASGVMAYIVRGASAPDLTFVRTGGNLARGNIAAYYEQNTPTHGFDGGASAGSSTASPNLAAGGTTTTSNELIVAMVGAGRSSPTMSNFFAVTSPTTASGATDTTTDPLTDAWTERVDGASTGTPANSLGVFDCVKSTPGATGNLRVTMTNPNFEAMVSASFVL